VNVAFIFTTFMHALQMVMLKNGLPKDGPQMTGWQQLRVFIFGVFELLVWMKKFKAQVKK
jgi:putative membrane protein